MSCSRLSWFRYCSPWKIKLWWNICISLAAISNAVNWCIVHNYKDLILCFEISILPCLLHNVIWLLKNWLIIFLICTCYASEISLSEILDMFCLLWCYLCHQEKEKCEVREKNPSNPKQEEGNDWHNQSVHFDFYWKNNEKTPRWICWQIFPQLTYWLISSACIGCRLALPNHWSVCFPLVILLCNWL